MISDEMMGGLFVFFRSAAHANMSGGAGWWGDALPASFPSECSSCSLSALTGGG